MAPPFCPGRGNYVFYQYEPSLPAAIIFTLCFGVSSGWHIWQTWKKRSWFLIAFIIGGLMETIGYIGRILSWKDPCALGPFIMQTLLLLLGPALFAASIYMILGRIILLTGGEKFSVIRRTWLTKIFVGGDVLCFLMQGAGGGIMASAKGDHDKTKLGENLIVGGLFVQLAFFGFFVIAAGIFQTRGRQHLSSISATVPWKKHLYVLYFTSILILVRSIFRVIEYLQGNDGYLLSHEVYLYIFDALLMFAVMASMNIVHPGDIAILLKGKIDSSEFVELEQGYVQGNKTSDTNAPLKTGGQFWSG